MESDSRLRIRQSVTASGDEKLVIGGLVSHSWWRLIGVVLCGICTGGLLFLVLYWWPKLRASLLYEPATNPRSANFILVKSPTTGEWKIEPIISCGSLRIFVLEQLRYVLNTQLVEAIACDCYTPNLKDVELSFITVVSGAVADLGLNEDVYAFQQQLFGTNETIVPVRPIWQLLLKEALHPFYVFQIFSVTLWMIEPYIAYASCILVMSCASLGAEVFETRRNERRIADMASHGVVEEVTVIRQGQQYRVKSELLVPGDVIVILNGSMPCDAAVIDGRCVVDESMLTGESVPIQKPSLQKDDFVPDAEPVPARSIVNSGTRVIQVRPAAGQSDVLGVVLKTGYLTARGELLRSILHPKPSKAVSLNQDAFRFVGILAILALGGMIYSLVVLERQHVSLRLLIIHTLDLVTIIVPPALPAAMTVGTVFALNRLKNAAVYCTSPPRVNVAGNLNCLCFDKTGTLTEDSLDVHGFHSAEKGRFTVLHTDISVIDDDLVVASLASCHSLEMIINANGQHEIVGDPLDVKMLLALKSWRIEHENGGTQIGQYHTDNQHRPNRSLHVMRNLLFAPELKRAGVVVRDENSDEWSIFVKGAPEVIRELCISSSIPADFAFQLEQYTSKGFRVIAMASRSAEDLSTSHHNGTDISGIPRADLESGLTFSGFLVMRNFLKPETTGAIAELNGASIRLIMVTGDNALTGISVSMDCGLAPSAMPFFLCDDEGLATPTWSFIHYTAPIGLNVNSTVFDPSTLMLSLGSMESRVIAPSLAITGAAFAKLTSQKSSDLTQMLEIVLKRGCVFARMSPAQKAQLIELLQDRGLVVAMCGDGANDCGALKAAHVGISLSDTEASVAAPFTCRRPNILCVPALLKEGRAALTTSFAVFKYMATYSFIQFASVLILYSISSDLSDWEFLYVDLFIILLFAVLMGRQPSAAKLHSSPPPASLLSLPVMGSLACQLVLSVLVQAGAFIWLQHQFWYSPLKPDPNTQNFNCQENTIIFIVSAYQYITTAFVYMMGDVHRAPLYRNILLLLAFVASTVMTSCILFVDFEGFKSAFNLVHIPSEGLHLLAAFILGNFVASVLLERVVVPVVCKWWYRAPTPSTPKTRVALRTRTREERTPLLDTAGSSIN